MNQSAVIGAALIIAYAIFIITKGELPCYLQILGISTAAGCPPNLQPQGCGASTTGTSGGLGLSVNPVINAGGPGGVGIGIGSGGVTIGAKNPTANPGGGIGVGINL